MLSSFQSKISIAFIGLCAVLAASPVRAIDYLVTMDTTSVQGVTGYMTMDFLPTLSLYSANALVSGFNFDGTFVTETPMISGDVTGALDISGGVLMGNSTPFNSFSQAMTFGSYLGFTLTITSPVLNNPDPLSQGGTTFAYYLFDRVPNPNTPPPDFVLGNSLLTTGGPGDAVMTAELCDCGIVTVTPYFQNVVIVPEPGTILMASLATSILIGLSVTRKRRTA